MAFFKVLTKGKNGFTYLLSSEEFLNLRKGFTGAFLQKVLGAASSFFWAILIARYLGAEQAGVYYTALPIVMLCAFVSRGGFDQLVMRETASALSANGSSDQFNQIWHIIIVSVSSFTLVACLIVYIVAPFATEYFSQPELAWILKWLIVAIMAIVVFNLAAQIIRGANNIWKSSFILFASSPICCLIIVGCFILLNGHNSHSSLKVVILSFSMAALLTACLSVKWAMPFIRQIKGHCSTVPSIILQKKNIINSGFSFLVYGIGLRGGNWIASLILAKYHEADQVAIFNSAVRVSTAVSFILTAVVITVGPNFVRLYRTGEYDRLKKLYLSSIGLTIIVATPIVIACWCYADIIMGFFGNEFKKGGIVLVILTIGQFFSAVIGPQAQILIAINMEHTLKYLTILSFISGTLLHLALVPQFGAVGSASAVTAAAILINLVTLIIVSRFWINLKRVQKNV